jgi:hypothetical protein
MEIVLYHVGCPIAVEIRMLKNPAEASSRP